MASNQKLTKLIAGRAIAACTQVEGLLTLTLDDGATMRVKTTPAATAPTLNPAVKIKKVRQRGTELDLDLEDGTTFSIHLAEATSSVVLRDHAGKLEYAD